MFTFFIKLLMQSVQHIKRRNKVERVVKDKEEKLLKSHLWRIGGISGGKKKLKKYEEDKEIKIKWVLKKTKKRNALESGNIISKLPY